ncbi:MAG: TRAP transporter large permease subunit [Deltaproteobacteria bacterium]|nr:TRAP transporter large permease subunit [Deltaproteobacteria bacterium]
MSIELLTVLIFGTMVFFLFMGLPVAFACGVTGIIFTAIFQGASSVNVVPTRIFGLMTNYLLDAIPLFIFMANILERSGIIEDIYHMVYNWLGWLKGGVATATVAACTMMAAMAGVVGATEVTMGLIALPQMLNRKYDKLMSLGAILAGGTLGILIPPSVLLIVYGMVDNSSIGQLYAGAFLPGFLLSALYISYITIRCYIKPEMGPPIPKEERLDFIGLLKVYLIAIVKGRMGWKSLVIAAENTIKASAMVMWTMFGANIFIALYIMVGGQAFVSTLLLGSGFGPMTIIWIMMLILIFLGCFIDWVGIVMLCVPLFGPIIRTLGFDPIWFGVLFAVNMQMAFLSPPFGFSLFYLKSVAPPEVSTVDVWKSALPFLGLQFIGLVLCMYFPDIILIGPKYFFRGLQ